MIVSFMLNNCRLPRKVKKQLIKDCGRSEWEAQSYLIRCGELSDYVLTKSYQ